MIIITNWFKKLRLRFNLKKGKVFPVFILLQIILMPFVSLSDSRVAGNGATMVNSFNNHRYISLKKQRSFRPYFEKQSLSISLQSDEYFQIKKQDSAAFESGSEIPENILNGFSPQYPAYDYRREAEEFRIYQDSDARYQERYRDYLIRHDRNLQHYHNNLYLQRETEFYRMMSEGEYAARKRALVGVNYLLTDNLSPGNFAESSYLMLKGEDKLLLNNSLNLLHRTIGTREVQTEPGWIALDIHVHTYHSFDGTSNLKTLLLKAHQKGFQAIAITDHDYFDETGQALQIAGSLKRQGKLPENFVVVPGMEISSRDGHILGLFLKSYIPHGMSAEQTIDEIHRQGGLAIAPHPYQPDFGIGPKLVKLLNFDGMVLTGVGPEFRLAEELAEEVGDRMAIFMDSDTHVENGLAWMGYTLVETSEISSEGIYYAIKDRQTKPVHQNVMAAQSEITGSKFTRMVSQPVVQIFQIRHQMETLLATVLPAERVQMVGIVPNIMNDFTSLSLMNPFSDHFFGSGRLDTQFIQGIEAYYGAAYLNVRRENRNVNIKFGMKLNW